MIYEGSCDTEDWSIDAENSALPSQKLNIYKIFETVIIFTDNISVFDQINAIVYFQNQN